MSRHIKDMRAEFKLLELYGLREVVTAAERQNVAAADFAPLAEVILPDSQASAFAARWATLTASERTEICAKVRQESREVGRASRPWVWSIFKFALLAMLPYVALTIVAAVYTFSTSIFQLDIVRGFYERFATSPKVVEENTDSVTPPSLSSGHVRPLLAPADPQVIVGFSDVPVRTELYAGLAAPNMNYNERFAPMMPPPPYGTGTGTATERDARLLATPVPDSVVTPEGALVVFGRPPVAPVPRPRGLTASTDTSDFSEGLGGGIYFLPNIGCIAVWHLDEFNSDGAELQFDAIRESSSQFFYIKPIGEPSGYFIFRRRHPSVQPSIFSIGQYDIRLDAQGGLWTYAVSENISSGHMQFLTSRAQEAEVFKIETISSDGTTSYDFINPNFFDLYLNLPQPNTCEEASRQVMPPLQLTSIRELSSILSLDLSSFSALLPVSRAVGRNPAMLDADTQITLSEFYPVARPSDIGLLGLGDEVSGDAFAPQVDPISISSPIVLDVANTSSGWVSVGPALHSRAYPDILFIVDEVHVGDGAIITEFLKEQGVTLVVLSSPGGVVYDSVVIAEEIKNLGISTYIPESAECMSACVYMFLGGGRRLAAGSLWAHQLSVAGVDDDVVLVDANDVLPEMMAFAMRVDDLNAPDWLMDIIVASPELVSLTVEQRRQLEIEPHIISSQFNLSLIDALMDEMGNDITR